MSRAGVDRTIVAGTVGISRAEQKPMRLARLDVIDSPLALTRPELRQRQWPRRLLRWSQDGWLSDSRPGGGRPGDNPLRGSLFFRAPAAGAETVGRHCA